ncbi:hypothetical protein Tco_0982790 [Tanacetum coccineum]
MASRTSLLSGYNQLDMLGVHQVDRHWDTPISVNVRANVNIVVGVVRCDNPAFQVLMLEEIDEHLTTISECD